MKAKLRDTAIFFTILYWLLVVFFIFDKKVGNIKSIKFLEGLVLILGNLIIILLSKFLIPIFDFVLVITKKIGSFLFSLISSIVFYLILTPIAVIMRLNGKAFLEHKIDKKLNSYYKEYQKSKEIEKQF